MSDKNERSFALLSPPEVDQLLKKPGGLCSNPFKREDGR
jgi:hypothetical protein